MSDEGDEASEYVARADQSGIDKARAEAAAMPAGFAGECVECGEKSKRLVIGLCAPCRDIHNKIHSRGYQR